MIRSEARGHVLEVEVQRDGVDLREDRRGSATGDRLGGRVESGGRGDHPLAGTHPERGERGHQRLRPVRHPRRPPGAEGRRTGGARRAGVLAERAGVERTAAYEVFASAAAAAPWPLLLLIYYYQ